MIPPVDPTVLESNPQFAEFYKTLTSTVLNPDGSTRNASQAKIQEEIQEVNCFMV